MRTIVCLGHAALDRIYSVPQMPAGSTKVRATAYSEVGGDWLFTSVRLEQFWFAGY